MGAGVGQVRAAALVRRARPRDRRGVATVLGALLVLGILVAAFGLVLTQAVPAWMAQEESGLEAGVAGSLEGLQATLALQAGTGAPPVAYQGISLSSGTVPLLASPTVGSLVFSPRTPGAFVNVSWSSGGALVGWENRSLGALTVALPNRYLPPVDYTLQGGMVVAAAPGGPAYRLVSPPPIAFSRSGGTETIDATWVTMEGPGVSTGGAGPHQIVDQLLGRTVTTGPATTASAGTLAVSWTVGGPLACPFAAWAALALAGAGVPPSQYSITAPAACGTGGAGTVTMVVVAGIGSFTLRSIDVGLGITAGTGGGP
ncbi:MAG: hypothetical protein QXG65_06625 [Thermoplasmata archaeon]